MKSRPVLLALLVSLVPLALLVWRFNFLCDDAFISYRYARNLSQGLGLVFNPGVEPPVEGYTNLLWILVCAVFERFQLDVGLLSRVTSVGLAIVCLAAMIRLIETQALAVTRRHQFCAPLFAGLLVGLHPAFATWATSGMETMAFTACLFLGFERLMLTAKEPRTLQSAVLLSAAALLRADGVVACAAVLLAVLVFGFLESRRDLRKSTLQVSAVVVIVVTAQIGFRFFYHGDWIPNTAHAKVSLGSAIAWKRGAIYVAHFLVLFPAIASAPLLALMRSSKANQLRSFALASLIPFLAIYLWYLAVGGDYMAFGRFLVPAIPFAGLLFGYACVGAEDWKPSKLRLALMSGLLATQILPAFGWSVAPESLLASLNFRLHKSYENQVEGWKGLAKGVERGREKGLMLKRITRAGDSMVAGAVGAQAYYSDLFIFDRLGLVTREVALREVEHTARAAGHDKGVPAEFFLKDRPTIMHVDVSRGKGRGSMTVPAELEQHYEAVEFPASDGRKLRLLVLRGSHLAPAQ
ncbi:MAG: arabinofuranosyltransferase [Planctomycetota bacterium]